MADKHTQGSRRDKATHGKKPRWYYWKMNVSLSAYISPFTVHTANQPSVLQYSCSF